MKPFTQIPSYDKEAKVAIPIKDFIELQEFLKIFAQPFALVQNAYINAVKEKIITFTYKEEDGTEITEDEARNRIQAFNESVKKEN